MKAKQPNFKITNRFILYAILLINFFMSCALFAFNVCGIMADTTTPLSFWISFNAFISILILVVYPEKK